MQILKSEKAYDLWAETYDESKDNAVLAAEEHAASPLIRRVAAGLTNAVDFGCGTGRHIPDLLDAGVRSVVAIDQSYPMLMRARSKFPHGAVSFVRCRLLSLPIRPGSFDLGLACLVLGHEPSLSGPLKTISSALKPGGHLVISELHPDFEKRGWKRTFSVRGTLRQNYAVENFAHQEEEYQAAFKENALDVRASEIPKVDESLKPIFDRTGMTDVYQQFQGAPLLLVYLLRKK
ncbi:MAG TPA: class I SAM-dependent methyltransferase [Bacteroidota bacterium]|nr:class I SAM-dependent methyltransferase [Bacteroidota bacterium]